MCGIFQEKLLWIIFKLFLRFTGSIFFCLPQAVQAASFTKKTVHTTCGKNTTPLSHIYVSYRSEQKCCGRQQATTISEITKV